MSDDGTVRIGVIGDVHWQVHVLADILDAGEAEGVDAWLLVGDLVVDRRAAWYSTGREVLAAVAERRKPVVFVPGNHDPHDLPGIPGAENADGRRVPLLGLTVAGLGGAGPARFGFPYEWDEADVRRRPLPPADILLVHAPPARTDLDRTASGDHAGSEAIRERAASGAYRILVCGHIHEAAGCQVVEGTPCFNVGALGAPFGLPQYGTIVFRPEGIEAVHRVLPTATVRHWRFRR